MPRSTKILRLVLAALMLSVLTLLFVTTEGVWSFDSLFVWILVIVPGVALSWRIVAPVFSRQREHASATGVAPKSSK